MEKLHDGHIDELDGRLAAALAGEDDVEVRKLLSEIGKAEFDANAPKKRIRPAPINGDGP